MWVAIYIDRVTATGIENEVVQALSENTIHLQSSNLKLKIPQEDPNNMTAVLDHDILRSQLLEINLATLPNGKPVLSSPPLTTTHKTGTSTWKEGNSPKPSVK